MLDSLILSVHVFIPGELSREDLQTNLNMSCGQAVLRVNRSHYR
jgi:hypothetical protein